jgi:GNAT superfamily N-acetyltransferase
VLRDFRPADQVAVRSLVLDGLRERWGDDFDPSFNPDLVDITSHYVDHDAEVVVIELEGEIAAIGVLVPDGGAGGRLLRVSVAFSHRRRGLARQIVSDLVERGQQRRMIEIRVLTDTPWTSAVELYRACGFTDLGSDGTDTHFVLRL